MGTKYSDITTEKRQEQIETTLETLETNAFDSSSDSIILSIEKTEDAAHTTADKGLMLLAVRKDTAVALAGTDADYIPLIVDANGRLHVIDPSASGMATDIGTIDDDTNNIKLAVQVMDDWDDGSDNCKTKEQFGGAAYSKNVTVSDTPTLFEASEHKLRDVIIQNVDAAEGAKIGIYDATIGTFRGTGFTLEFGESMGFTKIDLNTLAYASHTNGDTPVLEIIGVEE